MRISDWSSDVCSSDLPSPRHSCSWCRGRSRSLWPLIIRPCCFFRRPEKARRPVDPLGVTWARYRCANPWHKGFDGLSRVRNCRAFTESSQNETLRTCRPCRRRAQPRSEEHTSELQSLMRISYAVFCLKKKNHTKHNTKP